MPATTAGKMLPSAWARPLKKKAQNVTSAAARERSRLIIREASGERLVYPGKGAPAMGGKEKTPADPGAALPAPLSLLERRLVRRQRGAVTQIDPERARVGEQERSGRNGRLDRAGTEDALRRGDGRQRAERGNRIDLEHAPILHGQAPWKVWHRTRYSSRCTLLSRHCPAPADTRAFFSMLPVG